MENPTLLTIVATLIGTGVTLGTLIIAVCEYRKQGAQKRADHFLALRCRLKDNQTFRELCALAEHDDVSLRTVPFKDKRDLLGFFEEVALAMNSRLIRPDVAHYMFAYYALRCHESEHFRHGVNMESTYWALFNDFCEQMRPRERTFRFSRRRMRF